MSRVEIEQLETRIFLSHTWFVSPSGNNAGRGTLKSPFRTIQRAANSARAGDTVEIETETYHETVTPRRSGVASAPITYEAYPGDHVVVTGADRVTKWKPAGGDIYVARIKDIMGAGMNDVFVDGVEISDARFPATGMETAQNAVENSTEATYDDSNLAQPPGYWVGATVHFFPGEQWAEQTGTVVSSSPGAITFSYIRQETGSYQYPAVGDRFYLTDSMNALMSPGQFFVRGKLLYAWMPGSDSPTLHDVEVKQRALAFNLNGKSNIVVTGLNITSATISTDANSANDVMDHLTATCTGQFEIVPVGWFPPANAGIMLIGADDVLQNSEISNNPGDGVYVSGPGDQVLNNVIHDVDTSGTDSAPIRIDVTALNAKIEYNTIFNAGRDGIQYKHPDNLPQSAASALTIEYNNISAIGQLVTDAGGIYTVDTNGAGTQIAYNQISDLHSGGFGLTGIYIDNGSSGFSIYDNVTSNVDNGMKFNYSTMNNDVNQNTLEASNYAVAWNGTGSWAGSSFTNNVFGAAAQIAPDASTSGNSSNGGTSVGAPSFAAGAVLPVGAG